LPVIRFLGGASADPWANYVRAFQQGLGETGYVEGRNVAIEYRWAEGQNERMSGLIADLLHRPVSVIAAPGNTPAALAAKAASTTVPIVFAVAADPVQLGLVASLNRPGGNITGVVTLNVEIAPKRLELLHELLPTATSFASERELDAALAAVARLQAAGLVIGPDTFFNSRIEQLATLTSGQALPAVYQWREFTAAGGLLSYGSSITDVYRQAGI
jgi:putative tryptophan/tyrosine transport system substrate-binding protein